MRRASILSGLLFSMYLLAGISYMKKLVGRGCLEYVEYNWKDLNPKSNQVREKTLAGKR